MIELWNPSLERAKKISNVLRDRWRAGNVERQIIEQHIGAWIAHAAHADTWRLRHAIFRNGWFDPLNDP